MFIKHYLFEDIWRCIFLFFFCIYNEVVSIRFFLKSSFSKVWNIWKSVLFKIANICFFFTRELQNTVIIKAFFFICIGLSSYIHNFQILKTCILSKMKIIFFKIMKHIFTKSQPKDLFILNNLQPAVFQCLKDAIFRFFKNVNDSLFLSWYMYMHQ